MRWNDVKSESNEMRRSEMREERSKKCNKREERNIQMALATTSTPIDIPIQVGIFWINEFFSKRSRTKKPIQKKKTKTKSAQRTNHTQSARSIDAQSLKPLFLFEKFSKWSKKKTKTYSASFFFITLSSHVHKRWCAACPLRRNDRKVWNGRLMAQFCKQLDQFDIYFSEANFWLGNCCGSS